MENKLIAESAEDTKQRDTNMLAIVRKKFQSMKMRPFQPALMQRGRVS